MTKRQDLVDDIYIAGDYLDIVVTVEDSDGDPIDISDFEEIRYGIIKLESGGAPIGAPVILKTLGDGVAITNGVGGQFTVTLANGETDNLRGTYYHEAEVEDDNNHIATIFIGQFTIVPQGLLPPPSP